MLVPDLRPLSVGEIIDVAIKIWRRYLPTLARTVFAVVAPLEILSALVAASVGTSDTAFERIDAAGNTVVDTRALGGWLAGMLSAQLLSGLAFLIASAAVLQAVSVAYLGGTPQWRESLRAATGRLGSLLWLAFLMVVGLGFAMLAVFGPFIWLGVSWSVAFPVLIAEGQRGSRALGRSFRLVRGRWWPTFGALALAFLFQFFVGLVFGVPLAFVTANWDSASAAALAVSTLVSVASSVITTPFMAAVLVLLYFDLRVRKEGFDLQLMSQGVGVPGAVPSGGPGPWTPPGDGPGPGSWPAPRGSPPPNGGAAPVSWPAPSGWPPPTPPPPNTPLPPGSAPDPSPSPTPPPPGPPLSPTPPPPGPPASPPLPSRPPLGPAWPLISEWPPNTPPDPGAEEW